MVRFTVQESAASALHYLVDELSRDDLSQELLAEAGRWHGKGAERLGLSDAVTRELFARVVSNVHPFEERSLSDRSSIVRTAGVHVTIDAPKSVSLLYAVSGDLRVREAVVLSARDAMREAESRAQARVRKDGADTDRVTGELLCAEFVHRVARPVEGTCDPQLHLHYFVFNQTFDSVEGKWKALQSRGMWMEAPVVQAVFEATLIRRLVQLGYTVDHKGDAWEVAGVPHSAIEKFSRRTEQIQSEAKDRGVTDPAELDGIGVRTRGAKLRGATISGIRAEWVSRLSTEENVALLRVRDEAEARCRQNDPKPRRGLAGLVGPAMAEPKVPAPLTSQEKAKLEDTMRVTIGALFERAAVVPERMLMVPGLRAVPGRVHPQDVRELLERSGVLTRVLDGQRLCTTREAAAEERELIDLVTAGKGRYVGRSTERVGKLRWLTEEQRQAVVAVLGSPDLVTVIEGRSGVGKTRLTGAAVQEIWVNLGCPVQMLAPTARAARGVLRSEGHQNAETVAKFLVDENLQKRAMGGIIWVDEAGLLGTKDLKQLLKVAAEQKCRVVLMGDDRQHRAVARSGWWDAMQRYAEVRSVTVEGVMRQRGALKEVAENLNRGDFSGALSRLDSLGAVRVHARQEVLSAAAADYVSSRRGSESVVLVVQTHRQAAETTSHIRSMMRERGELKDDRKVETLQRRGLAEAERKEASSYRAGDVVEFHQKVKTLGNGTFERKSRWEVLGQDPFGNVVVRSGLDVRALPCHRAAAFEVFQRSQIDLAPGDVVRITQNAKVPAVTDRLLAPFVPSRREASHSVSNGDIHEVVRVSANGSVKLANGLILPKGFGHLAHGYCVTSHAAQGLTFDRSITVMTSEVEAASNQRHFYVGCTRGSKSVRVYTDDRASLEAAVLRGDGSGSATDMLARGKTESRVRAEEHARRVAEEFQTKARQAEQTQHERDKAHGFTR